MAVKITRTIATGYVFDVFKKTGNTLEKTGEVISPVQLRSIKQQKLVLAENNMEVESVLIFNRANETKYEISEEDFIKYASVVTEVKPEVAPEVAPEVTPAEPK